MDYKFGQLIRLAGWVVVWLATASPVANGQADDEEEPIGDAKEDLRRADQVMNVAKSIGPWEQQTQFFEQATDNLFSQHGWTSEPDRFARTVMHEVGQVPPWDPKKRQEVFLNQLQIRYGLNHDQLQMCDKDFQREGMRISMKHIKDIVPVALEVIKTRAADEPFTPEQVQRWSDKLSPILNELGESIERVTDKLERTMALDQRRILQEDMKAFRRRHEDVKKMVERWKAGQWTPADWSLQDDPVHAGEMIKIAAAEEEKNALVEQAMMAKRDDEDQIARNEDDWERYVKWFCNTYQCDERQRTTAAGILAGCRKEALSYHGAKRDTFAEYERGLKATEDLERRKILRSELDKVMKPISDIFERMKKRLYEEVLTTHQRIKFTPAQSAKAGKQVGGE